MNRFLLWLSPGSWRERFGKEVLEMMDDSSQPTRDRLDLLKTAIKLRIREGIKDMWVSRKVIAAFGFVLSLTGLAAMWSAVELLSNGWSELPFHWWSAPTIVPVAVGLVIITAAILRRPGISQKTP